MDLKQAYKLYNYWGLLGLILRSDLVVMIKSPLKIILVFVLVFAMSWAFASLVRINPDSVGLAIADSWCRERGSVESAYKCVKALNSPVEISRQAVSLALFLLVVAFTALKMEWRVGAALLAVVVLAITGVILPQYLLEAVDWDLIIFLVGTMVFAGVLRAIGVFRFLAMELLKSSRGSGVVLVLLIALLAYALAAVLDEVTSIVYVAFLVLELGKIIGIDIIPLLVLSVLATNTGSSALPIGNPIGVYLMFSTRMRVSDFISYSLPLSMINLVMLSTLFLVIERKYVKALSDHIKKHGERVRKYIERYRIEVEAEKPRLKGIKIGLVVMAMFIAMVATSDQIAKLISSIGGGDVDAHAVLSFIPYIFVAMSFTVFPMERVSVIVEKEVEWASILFFIFLFMLGRTLTYTGVMAKLAYALVSVSTSQLGLLSFILVVAASLSSFLDNLSVVVALQPAVRELVKAGILKPTAFFALLFGGVFGGNYTPIGSTANIVAVGLAESRKIKISWTVWLRLAVVCTTMQICVAIMYTLLRA
jgi:Na+/H+ antiporter NhaD/arsenite permease-like protein